MKKIATYIFISWAAIACSSKTTQQHIVDSYPFAQEVYGKVKNMHVYKHYDFVSSQDSTPYLSEDYVAYTGIHYDENGKVVSRTKTEEGVTLKEIIEYDNGKQKGFFIKSQQGDKLYNATTIWHGSSSSKTILVNKNTDTAIVYTATYDDKSRLIKTNEDFKTTNNNDSRFPKGATLATRTKEYTYGTDGYINSITYLQGNPINGTVILTILERDDNNNPTLLEQMWRKDTGEKRYSTVKIKYEYYQ